MVDKRPLGVWEIPEGLDEMTDDVAEEIADSMADAIERLERSPAEGLRRTSEVRLPAALDPGLFDGDS